MGAYSSEIDRLASKKWFWRGGAIGIWLLNSIVFLWLVFSVLDFFKLPPPEYLNHRVHTYNSTHNAPSRAKSGVSSSEGDGQAKTVESDNDYNQNTLKYLFDSWDLQAQEGMWAAAILLVVISFFQLAVSIVALVFIHKTYSTQSKELRETQRANSLQLKAYLRVSRARSIYTLAPAPDENIIGALTESGLIAPVSEDDVVKKMTDGLNVIDTDNTLFFNVAFNVENIGDTPAWTVAPFYFTELEINYSGRRLFPVLGASGNPELRTSYIGPGDSVTMIACCLVMGIPGMPFSDDMTEVSDMVDFNFRAETNIEDIETRSSDSIRTITIVGSNGPPQQGDMAFPTTESPAEEIASNVDAGFFPLTSIRVAGDETR